MHVFCGLNDWWWCSVWKMFTFTETEMSSFDKRFLACCTGRSWWRHKMKTSGVTGHLCGEFTGHRWIPCTKASDGSFDVFFDLLLNKRLSKQWWGWWFEMPSCPLWRHCNVSSSVWHLPMQPVIKILSKCQYFHFSVASFVSWRKIVKSYLILHLFSWF